MNLCILTCLWELGMRDPKRPGMMFMGSCEKQMTIIEFGNDKSWVKFLSVGINNLMEINILGIF